MAYFPNSDNPLDAQCADCPLGYGWNDPRQGELFDPERVPLPCPTAFVQLTFNYKQCSNPELREAMSYLIADNGECQTRKLLLKVRREQ